MRVYTVNNFNTPFKAHAFLVAKGNEDLITFKQCNSYSDAFWQVEDETLTFNWEFNNNNVNFDYKINFEVSTDIQSELDWINNDIQDKDFQTIFFEQLEINGLNYSDFRKLKDDLGVEVGNAIRTEIEIKIENLNE